MKDIRLIRLTKNKICYKTKIFLPKNTIIHASHFNKNIWQIKIGNIGFSMVEFADFDYIA